MQHHKHNCNGKKADNDSVSAKKRNKGHRPMKYFLLIAAVPVAGMIYLKATKQSLSFEGGKPKLQKDSAIAAKKGAKEAVELLKSAAGVTSAKTPVVSVGRTIITEGAHAAEAALNANKGN